MLDELFKETDTSEDFSRESFLESNMEKARNNPNRFSYWFEPMKQLLSNSCFIPETKVISIPKEVNLAFWKSIFDGMPVSENALVKEFVKENVYPLVQSFGEAFVKVDGFSNKFDFEKAHLKNTDSVEVIAEKLTSTYNDWMMMGDGVVSEFVVRDFIHTKNDRPSIYNGMKLNTELRAFYDFDEKKLIGIVNYWHPNVMIPYLMNARDIDVEDFFNKAYDEDNGFEEFLKPIVKKIEVKSKELENMTSDELMDFKYSSEGRLQVRREEVCAYLSSYKDMVKEFTLWERKLETILTEVLSENKLSGRWSLDFMVIDENEVAFIDAAKMENSALVEWIEGELD